MTKTGTWPKLDGYEYCDEYEGRLKSFESNMLLNKMEYRLHAYSNVSFKMLEWTKSGNIKFANKANNR